MHPKSTIERYVADGLPESDERELRRHLKECEECRAHYDRERLLMRALAGDANRATAVETAMHQALAARAIFPPSEARPRVGASNFGALLDRLVWAPARFWIGAATAALLLIAILLPLRNAVGTMPVAATVLRAKGATITTAGAGGKELVEGSELRAIDVVQVASGGLVELVLARGGTLRVFPDTELALGARGESVALERGKVWCLPESGKGSFVVTTETATVRVLGTSFVVDATSEITDVRVVSGSVEVEDSEGHGVVRLQQDEGTRVARGESPSPPRRASTSADENEWERFLDELMRAIDNGVKAIQREMQRSRGRE